MFAKHSSNRRNRLAALMAVAALAVGACSGGGSGATGAQGATGASGSQGAGGSILTQTIGSAQTVTGAITGVAMTGSALTVYFRLVDQKGEPLRGLQASQISFQASKLVPGQNGASSAWQAYINTLSSPGTGPWWGTQTTRQPTTETATAAGAVFTDNGDGTYAYTFSKGLDAYTGADVGGSAIPFEPTLTHRVGFEIRGTGANASNNNTNNPTYTWLPATGATVNLLTRDIVGDKECDACHGKFAMHGGARVDVSYCVLCHNPGNTDAQSGNTLDFKVMVHKIHSGASLPSVVAAGSTAPAPGVGYSIWGYGNTLYNFNTVVWPQDTRNCQTCHNAADPATPDANNFQSVPNAAACGACHDTVNFATGANHGPTQQPVTDADCVTCHGPNATANAGAWQVLPEHVVPVLQQEQHFRVTVVKVEAVKDAAGTIPGATACVAPATACKVLPGEYPKITIKIDDPTTGNLWKLTDAPFATQYFATGATAATAARVRARIGYSTLNYTNPGSSTVTQAAMADFLVATKQANGTYTLAPAPMNADGSYTAVAATPIPANYTAVVTGGSGGVSSEARAIGNVAPANAPVQNGTIAIKAADPLYFPISDTTPVARREVVATANCLRCHKSLELHGGARANNVRLCIMCHNPAQAPRESYTDASGVKHTDVSEPVDFKFFIHSLHSDNYKFGVADFSQLGFPGVLNNCLACHNTDTYYPVDPTKVYATSIDAGSTPSDPTTHIAITANAAACGACHTGVSEQTHMKQNGAVVIADQFPAGLQYQAPNVLSPAAKYIKGPTGATLPQYQTETCTLCHGKGTTADVAVVHQTASFKYN